MTDIVVNCKGTMVHPNVFKTFLEQGMGLNKRAQKQAESLFLLAAALPNVTAGVLLDLVSGTLKYEIDEEKETFTILSPQ